jgi:hypothetical protein
MLVIFSLENLHPGSSHHPHGVTTRHPSSPTLTRLALPSSLTTTIPHTHHQQSYIACLLRHEENSEGGSRDCAGSPFLLFSSLSEDTAEVEANVNSKGAEHFSRPLHTLRVTSSRFTAPCWQFSAWCWAFPAEIKLRQETC